MFKTKVELGVELVERAVGWAIPRAPVLGDHAYGESKLRERLDQAGCEYVLSVGPGPLVFAPGTSLTEAQAGPRPRTERGRARTASPSRSAS